ncbi:MAG: transporter substrate-binding domain-containing protein [Deltaproteobacteria bacterium]|nr:transporter substrate-binding domain-containing protein [Deltaproteobacteria bacterium]MBW2120629.1 transporter substrate-binding domain-containing protein [Deltaproteobacteria bacterium]
MKVRSFLFGAIVVALVVAMPAGTVLAGKIQRALIKESTLEQIMRRGTLRVGFSTFIPWAMKNKKGEFIGNEIDVARKLAEDMGVKVEFVNTKWSGIIPALLTGKFDIIIGGMAMTPQRNLKVNFTIPYYYAGGALVANRKLCEPFHPTKLEDFNRPEVIFAERMGATPVEFIQQNLPKAQIRLFDDQAPAYQELRNGKAYAIIGDAPRPFFEALDYPDLLYLPLGKQKVYELAISFALRKGDLDWLNYLNNWITYRRTDGWIQKRYDYWFTTKEWEDQIK